MKTLQTIDKDIDIVKVIRCKKCKFHKPINEEFCFCFILHRAVPLINYCMFGKKREEN